MIHVIIINTSDNFYTIVPMNPHHTSSLGISSTKRLAKELFDAINKAKAQVEQFESPKDTFCINCGRRLEQDSDFCGNCGKNVS